MIRYGAICCDPPWHFETYRKVAYRHYRRMSLEQIKAIPINSYAADDCVLFLWTTDTHLRQAFEVIDAWQFTYKTVGFNWVKTTRRGMFHMGCGWWTRANSEMCLLATRGKPKRKSMGIKRLVVSTIREHSRKPDEVYDRITKLVHGPYLEMFARTQRDGWDYAYSDEVSKF